MNNKLTKWGSVGAFLAMVLSFETLPAAPQFDEKIDPEKKAEEAKEHAAINADLESVAREIAMLLKHPGFRGQLRGEINGSKAVEGIIELDKFLAKAAKDKKAPPGLAKARGATDKASQRIKASPAWALEGIDLYFPVEDHKAKWKGNEDLLVAYSPVNDEAEITSIVGFTVKTGEKITLDPAKPPAIPVLIVAAEEHDSHEIPIMTRDAEIVAEPDFDLEKLPEPDVVGKDPADMPIEQEKGNSYVGITWMYVRDMKEPWTRGRPELKVWFGHRKGNYCTDPSKTWRSGPLYNHRHERRWERASYLPSTGSCQYNGNVCFFFDDSYYPKMVLYIYEQDGGSSSYKINTLYPGVTCSWFPFYSGDDYVDSAYMYRHNFNFNYDYNHDMGNAYIKWHKVH